MSSLYNSIIIGGGPAGVSCALELINEHETNFLLLEKGASLGGKLHIISCSVRDLGGVYFDSGQEYLNSLQLCIDKFKVPYRTGAIVQKVDLLRKIVFVAGEKLEARTMVIAAGVRTQKLMPTGQNELCEQIIYYVEGREKEIWGKRVVVVGGGDSAVIEAINAAKNGSVVTVVSRSPLRARPDLVQSILASKNIEVLQDYEVVAVLGTSTISAIEVLNRSTGDKTVLPTEIVVAKIGSVPNSELFTGQIALDQEGYVIVDQHMQTSVTAVYAAGDIIDARYLRIGTAIGGGVAIAHEILRSLGLQKKTCTQS
jgi:thioredoxin reductase (NADPH)